MHYYNPDSGRRVKEILKADGTPYKAVPSRVILERGYVPGVTDIMKYASPYTGLQFYERKVAIQETYNLLSATRRNLTDAQREKELADIKAYVGKVLEQPANDGTRKHIAFAGGVEKKIAKLEGIDRDIAVNTYTLLSSLFPEDKYEWASEFEFANKSYGGTMDLVIIDRKSGKPVALGDAKFPTSERETRDTECVQLAAYGRHLIKSYNLPGWDSLLCFNLMFDDNGGIYKKRKYSSAQLDLGWGLFKHLFMSYRWIKALAVELKEKLDLETELSGTPDVT